MWRRPLEWNLNGTTDPRDGSVDHLSLNSLKDRHGPIRAPKSLDVDRWTGLAACFTHQRNGRPSDNKEALLTAILADGINLGLTSMADACRGATLRQLAWAYDWHIREETYATALARLIDFHRALPLARLWGTGATSSSDGHYYRAGGHGEALGDINARHGNEPGVAFYTHISDQFGPYY